MIWIRVLIGVLGGSALLALSLLQIDWPPQFWALHKEQVVSPMALLAAVGIPYAAYETIRAYRREVREARRDKAQVPLLALFRRLLMMLGTDLQERRDHHRDLGVCAFMVRRRWVLPRLWPRRELVKFCDLRLLVRPHTGVRWDYPKGAIGACWAVNGDVGVCFDQIWGGSPSGDLRQLSESEWNALDAATRYHLDYTEMQRTKHIGAVIATPIQGRGDTFKGCVCVDCSADQFDRLFERDAREEMQDAAQAIARNLGLM